jgi:hypothetical protein
MVVRPALAGMIRRPNSAKKTELMSSDLPRFFLQSLHRENHVQSANQQAVAVQARSRAANGCGCQIFVERSWRFGQTITAIYTHFYTLKDVVG